MGVREERGWSRDDKTDLALSDEQDGMVTGRMRSLRLLPERAVLSSSQYGQKNL